MIKEDKIGRKINLTHPPPGRLPKLQKNNWYSKVGDAGETNF